MIAITNSVTTHKTCAHWFVFTMSYQRRYIRPLVISSKGIKVVYVGFTGTLADGLHFGGLRLNTAPNT
jgi:hypothetical protein